MTQHLDPETDKAEYLPYAPAWTGGPRSLADVQTDLKRPIHPNFIKTKPRKNRKTGVTVELPFIEWHTAVRILDRYAPGWQYRPNAVISLDGQHVVVVAEIGIPTSDYGMVWRGATGSDEEDETSYGDASDRAEGAAYRRAASKFGLNLASYYERGTRQSAPQAQQARQQPQERRNGAEATLHAPTPPNGARPPAETLHANVAVSSTPLPTEYAVDAGQALATDAQQTQIRNLVGSAGMNMDELLSQLKLTSLAELPAGKAGKVIARLQNLTRERRGGQVPAAQMQALADVP